jgi:PAS domain S-box-containing protein
MDLVIMPMCARNGALRHWVVCCTDSCDLRQRLAASQDALAGQRAARRRDRDLLQKARAELRRQHEVVRQEHVALQSHYAAQEASRQLQTALRASVDRFRKLFDADLIGVVIVEDECIVEANHAFLRLVGYTRADVAARHLQLTSMTPLEYAPQVARARTEILERGTRTPFEKKLWRHDGTLVPVLMGGALLEREPLRWVAFVLDLTERKRLEDEREEARASELASQKVAEQLDEYFAMAAHDIRTPVTSLSGNLEMAHALVRRLLDDLRARAKGGHGSGVAAGRLLGARG